MSSATVPLRIEQGATFEFGLGFNEAKNSDGSQGDPIDISTWVFVGQIRSSYSSPLDVQDFTFAAGAETNQVIISIPAASTALMPALPANSNSLDASPYAYDIFATLPDAGGKVLKILQGPVNVVPRVTVTP